MNKSIFIYSPILLLAIAFAGCATCKVNQAENLTAGYAGTLSINLNRLARHQDDVMAFLNHNLDLQQSVIQSNTVLLSTGALQASHQEQVAKVINLLTTESESHAQVFFSPPAAAASTGSATNLAATRKGILDALNTVNQGLTNLANGLSATDELKFIAGYAEAVAGKVADAQAAAEKNAQTGVNKTAADAAKSGTP